MRVFLLKVSQLTSIIQELAMNTVALVMLVVVAAGVAQQRATRQFFSDTRRAPLTGRPFDLRPVSVYRPIPAARQQYIPVYKNRNTESAQPPVTYVPIISQTNVRDDKGYSYSYESGDKTVVSERGLLKPGPEGDYIVAEGSFSFVAPDGTQYTVTYKADENGFQPEGAHLPKPVEENPPSRFG